MDTLIIACETLKNEIERAQKNVGTSYPAEYIESGLHPYPKKLSGAVNRLFEEVSAERVLFCLGQCGNALIGVKTGSFELVMPKTDDCLSLLLGSAWRKSSLSYKDKAFFITEGWLKGDSTIMSEYKKTAEQYDEETALEILQMMYANYKTIGLIDTGAGHLDELYKQTENIAQLLGFTRKTYEGTISYIEQLLTGPWPKEKFIIKAPHEEICEADFKEML